MNKVIFRLDLKDGSYVDMEISKAIQMRLASDNSNKIFIEQLNDGTYRFMWTEGLIKEFSEVENISIIRQDK